MCKSGEQEQQAPSRIVVGYVSGVHGIKGWLKIHSYTDPLENIFSYRPWLLSKQGVTSQVEALDYKVQGNRLIASIDDCDSRDSAETLKGAEISILENQLVELTDGEYYWRELKGRVVTNLQGEKLGKVETILETGANDVLVVSNMSEGNMSEGKSTECLIPWRMGSVVKEVDLEGSGIIVDWQIDW